MKRPTRPRLSRAKTAARPRERRPAPLVGLIMGSRSDLDTLGAAREVLVELKIPHEVRVVSAHRTPDWKMEYASGAEARGLEVVIAGAGGATHLPGMVAASTVLPVLGVPIEATAPGPDALMSTAQMPKGAGRHARDRPARGGQRGAARRADPGRETPRDPRTPAPLAARAHRGRARRARDRLIPEIESTP